MDKLEDFLNGDKAEKREVLDEVKRSGGMEEVEYLYNDMFEDAEFAVDVSIEQRLLPNKYKSHLKKIVLDLRKMKFDILKDLGDNK